jgi:hypothetical protein
VRASQAGQGLAPPLQYYSSSPIPRDVPARLIQQEQPASGARKIDEFGDIQVSDLLARLDNFAIELMNAPTSKAFIVAYGVPNKLPGWPLRRAQWAKGYLITGTGINAERIAVFNGGYRDAVMVQLWIVEAGAQLPVQRFDFGAALARERSPFLFDQFYLPVPSPDELGIDSGYDGYLKDEGRYEPFVTALRLDPGARGCIIAYATHRNRRGTDRRLAAQQKLALIKAHNIEVDRIITIAGGLREERTVELWLVPPGSPLPTPTPTVKPARRRRR